MKVRIWRSGHELAAQTFGDHASLRLSTTRVANYKVRITADGTEWYISKLMVWVPSKHLFRVREYITPPQSPYWRTGNSALENQFAKVTQSRKLKPFPASGRYR